MADVKLYRFLKNIFLFNTILWGILGIAFPICLPLALLFLFIYIKCRSEYKREVCFRKMMDELMNG